MGIIIIAFVVFFLILPLILNNKKSEDTGSVTEEVPKDIQHSTYYSVSDNDTVFLYKETSSVMPVYHLHSYTKHNDVLIKQEIECIHSKYEIRKYITEALFRNRKFKLNHTYIKEEVEVPVSYRYAEVNIQHINGGSQVITTKKTSQYRYDSPVSVYGEFLHIDGLNINVATIANYKVDWKEETVTEKQSSYKTAYSFELIKE